MALQQAQFGGHGVHELLRIVCQVEGVFLQHGWEKRKTAGSLPVKASRSHGFHPHGWMAAEAEGGVCTYLGHPHRQLLGAADADGRIGAVGVGVVTGAMGKGQSSRLQAGRDSRIGWHQSHQHPVGAESAGPASPGWIEIVWTD